MLSTGLAYWISNVFTIALAFEMVPPHMRCRDGQQCDYSQACSEGGYSFMEDSLRNMTYEWSLVCDRQYIGSLIGIGNFVGIALGSIVASWTSNRYGRKKTTILGAAFLSSGLMAAYFTPSPWIMILVSSILGTGTGLVMVGSMLLQMEMTDSEHRSWFVGIMYANWSGSTIMQPVLFYIMPDWRDVMLPQACLALVTLFLLFTVTESVRWLAINQADSEATVKVLQGIARFNSRPAVTIKLNPMSKQTPTYTSVTALFSTCKLRYRMFVLSVLEIMMNLGYYGLFFSIPSYFGNIYINGIVLGIGEMIPFLAAGKFISKCRRKASNFVTLMGSGLVLLLAWGCQSLPCTSTCESRVWIQTVVLFLGIFLVGSYCVAIAVLCIEEFNSHMRGPAAGVLNAIARIGGIVATLLMLLHGQWGVPPLVVIGGTAVVASLLIFTIPETLGRDMEEDSVNIRSDE